MSYNLDYSDEFPVLKKCRKCGGTKTATDEAGNISPCTTYDDRGKEIVPVPFREIAAYIGEEIAKQIRLKTGTHR